MQENEKDPKSKTNPDDPKPTGIAAAALEGAEEAQQEAQGVGMSDPRSAATTSGAVGDEQTLEDEDAEWRSTGGGPDAVDAQKSTRKSVEGT